MAEMNNEELANQINKSLETLYEQYVGSVVIVDKFVDDFARLLLPAIASALEVVTAVCAPAIAQLRTEYEQQGSPCGEGEDGFRLWLTCYGNDDPDVSIKV